MHMTFRRRFLPVPILSIVFSALAVSQQNAQPSTPDEAAARAKASAIQAPRAIYTPDPEYSMEARKHNVQGVVVLSLKVEEDGTPSNIKVKRSLRPDLDQNAMEAVKKWKFAPATKDGNPVAVNINIEVNFRLYRK